MGNPLWFNLLRYVSFPASRFDAGKNSHRRDLDCVGVAISPVGSACIQKNGRRSNPICANDRRRGRTFVESSRDRIRALQGDLSRDVRSEHHRGFQCPSKQLQQLKLGISCVWCLCRFKAISGFTARLYRGCQKFRVSWDNTCP